MDSLRIMESNIFVLVTLKKSSWLSSEHDLLELLHVCFFVLIFKCVFSLFTLLLCELQIVIEQTLILISLSSSVSGFG